ncbi:lipid-A-disaccharide synthase [Thermodesulfatator atlanticus]|uniref:lipid-A-disaccharide synthase n=1 Tax=Thermodesulfatator atlanticus TaxID=501497 RepID=UPI0003B36669|nr:lipid-A-disaccharide synthase [Thermodesulfatator atlanticus]
MSAGPDTTLHVFLVAGEASGDLHGASFLRALREIVPHLHAVGIGGPKLRAAGLQCLYPAESLAIMGLPSWQEVRKIIAIFRRIKEHFSKNPPALLVLIDFPEFNLRLARMAKRFGIPVFYYISPQIWAWRTRRVKLIKKVVDRMAVVLPFEVDFYQKFGYEVHFVGHPLIDVVRPALNRKTFFRLAGLNLAKPLIGIFPGSRPREIRTLLPLFLEAFEKIKYRRPGIQGVIVKAEGIDDDLIPKIKNPAVKVVKGYQYEVMAQSEAIMVASGTVTLEATIVGVPMVVAYKMGKLSYLLAKRLVKVPYASLPNLLAGKEVVPELLQEKATPDNLAEALLKFLEDKNYADKVRKGLSQIKETLGPGGASWRAAELAAGLLPQAKFLISRP